MNEKILIISSIEPNKYNKNGPSGLIWECKALLEKMNYSYDLLIIKDKNKLNKVGIYLKKINIAKIYKYDVILVYPFHLYFKLNKKARSKAIVLGPDSPSLLFKRFHNTSKGFNKIKYFILQKWFLYKEKIMLNNANKFLVVGKNDSRWLKYNHNNYSHKIFYLTHPILTAVIENLQKRSFFSNDEEIFNKPAIILSGNLEYKYVGNYIYEFINYINNIQIDILIVGTKNKWIYELIKGKKNNVHYIEWIEDYSLICNPKYHIHFIPLIAGAGTKNRTLTACAMGVTVFSTFIGLENILYNKPENYIFKVNSIKKAINELQKYDIILEQNYDVFLKNKNMKYINRVNKRFRKEFLNYLGLNYVNN